ncbi:MAG: outer membrane beta-barrel protein [Rhizomicrobium sp.]
MRLRFVLPALALAIGTLGAQAQIGLYFNPVATRISESQPDTGPFAFLGDNTTSRFFGGVDMGGYYNFAHEPAFDLGLDVRDTLVHGNNASLNTFMVAPRLARPLKYRLRPYVQVGIGAGRSKAELSTVRTTKVEWGVFAGVDYALNKHIDFRAIEVGYGSVTPVSSAIYNTQLHLNKPLPTATLVNISSGFVFRFGK